MTALRVRITQPGSLAPVWLDQQISEEQAEEIGRIVTGGCHLPLWSSVVDGSCTHPDHAGAVVVTCQYKTSDGTCGERVHGLLAYENHARAHERKPELS